MAGHAGLTGGRGGTAAVSNARLEDGRLVVGPCRCGAAQAPFGRGVRLAGEPVRLGEWRCRACWRADAEEARRASALGNAAASNPRIGRADIDAAAERLQGSFI